MVDFVRRGIPEEFQGITWRDYLTNFKEGKTRSTYEIIQRAGLRWIDRIIAKDTHLGLFLYGKNGCGKSTFGCLVIRTLLEKGIPAFRMTMQQVQELFYEAWKIPSITLVKDVLFLEEVGKDYGTKQGHSERALEFILKYRAERHVATIISANADIPNLKLKYGETVESILKGRYFPVNFPALDIRQLAGELKVKKFMAEMNEGI